jgi:hypothetical protein
MDIKIFPNIPEAEVPTPLITSVKIIVCWGIMACSLKETYQRLGETCCLHLHGIKYQTTNIWRHISEDG